MKGAEDGSGSVINLSLNLRSAERAFENLADMCGVESERRLLLQLRWHDRRKGCSPIARHMANSFKVACQSGECSSYSKWIISHLNSNKFIEGWRRHYVDHHEVVKISAPDRPSWINQSLCGTPQYRLHF
jgi:hypothetical protein